METLLKQDYVAPRLKSPLQTLYGRHYDLVDRYGLSIYFLRRIVLSSITANTVTELD